MAEYYVVRDKNTGLYFRGKGVNRWGKYYNQASIYRIKANAENTIKEVSWRGEQAEIVPIQIIESTADVVPKSEVASEIFAEVNMQIIPYSTDIYIKGEELIIIPKSDYNAILTELEKKYTEGEDKPASEEKYFSPEDVRKMTNQEVREKYTAIRKSMERW